MKTTAFIPIKMNNERIPGKNTKEFSDGTPLIHFVQKTLLKVKEIDDIYVFCSNEKINDYILDGIKFLKRPEILDTQKTVCGDIIRTFLNMVPSDIYIMANATSPFILPERFIQSIRAIKSGEYDSAFAAKKLQNFMWYRGKPLNFSLDYAPRTQDMEPYFCELSSPYSFTKEVFEKIGGRTGNKPFICECTDVEAIDIDYPEDFELADTVYMNLLKPQEAGNDKFN
ncbi:N-acylneuraminate cytidylyltransferase [Spirochaetia bacterium]|nr:N-acylneuraminate cytidylyltransferase [Spirochaetia bacterium]